MTKINYDALNEKFKPLFLEQYRNFINEQIEEINNSNYFLLGLDSFVYE